MNLDHAVAARRADDADVLDLDTALRQFAAFEPCKSPIAELRFFAGLSLEEAGEVLGLSLATVERDWQVARACLFGGPQADDA